MNIRISQTAVRFRLSAEEWHQLLTTGELRQTTLVPSDDQISLGYAVARDGSAVTSYLQATAFGLKLLLSDSDWDAISVGGNTEIRMTMAKRDAELTILLEKDRISNRARMESKH